MSSIAAATTSNDALQKDQKRSRTSEPHKAATTSAVTVAKKIQQTLRSGGSTAAIHRHSQETSCGASAATQASSQQKPSSTKASEVAALAEERRRERMKALTRNFEVCDLLDMRNVQSVAEHAPKITAFLLQEETRFLLSNGFMRAQTGGVTEKMRAFLVDWLIELHYKFKMWAETLYVAVGIVDRYLAACNDVSKQQLQCIGITAILIAGKYEEIYPPELKTVLRVVNHVVTKEEVLNMESSVLFALQFDVTFPSTLRFLERFGRLA